MDKQWFNCGFNFIIQESDQIARNFGSKGEMNNNDAYINICWINFMARKLKERINEIN